MATSPSSAPETATSSIDALAVATSRSNRFYQMWAPIWRKLAHAREGTGGFQDGTYLVAHPREYVDHSILETVAVTNEDGSGTTSQTIVSVPNPSPKLPTGKLIRRRQLARYENIAGKIVDQLKAGLFREQPTRRLGDGQDDNKPIYAFWEDVDRQGQATIDASGGAPDGSECTPIGKFLEQAWDPAATFGHNFIVMDRPRGPAPTTQADQAQPYLRMYTPLDAIDWLLDDLGRLTAIMFVEAAPRTTLLEPEQPTQYRLRLFNTEYWALYDGTMKLLEGGPELGKHQLGRIPVVTLYSKRRTLIPLVGHSVLDDPQLYVDLYNLTSEIRELLRNQTFGMLNVTLGADESVQDAQNNLGAMSGTESVLFSKGEARYISPAAENVSAYRDERNDLLRTIYRLSALAWESDSKDAESAGSFKLKREDINQMLSGFANELQRAELEIVELFYRAQYGPQRWQQQLLDDKVVVHYPDTFDATPFDVILAQAEAALALGMPAAFNKELKKRLVAKFLPDLPEALAATINAAIEAEDETQPSNVMSALLTRLTGKTTAAAPAAKTPEEQQVLDEIAKRKTTDGSMEKEAQVAA